MRIIGHLNGETATRLFVDYLYVKGIESEPEREANEHFAIWVRDEEDLEEARRHLDDFLANPSDPRFASEGQGAAELRRTELAKDEAYQKRVKDRAQMMNTLNRIGTGRFTWGLIGVCVAVFLLMDSSEGMWSMIWLRLRISNFSPGGGGIGLPEVLHGQVWRLVTPILMHGSFLHIFFNLWWLKDLGGILEWRMGWRSLAILIVVIAIGSNLAQYYVSGPNFLGISGVVFGLLGFIWMKGKYDPDFGLQLPPVIVFMMLLWLVLGYSGSLTGVVGAQIANTAHSAGLVMGMLCAFLPYWGSNR